MNHPQSDIRHRFVDVRGTTIHVLEMGNPELPPVLCVHGWPQHAGAWDALSGELASRYRLLCPDLFGFGQSAPMGPFDARRMSKRELARDLEAVLDALGLGPLPVIAHDWGCWVATVLAWRQPTRVSRLVLLAGLPPRFRPLKFLRFAPKLSYTLLIAAPVLGRRALLDGTLVPKMLRGGSPKHEWTAAELAKYTTAQQEPERARASTWLYRWLWLGEAPAAMLRGLLPFLRRHRLRMPTLSLLFSGDPVMSEQILARSRHEDLTVETLDAGHFVLDELPPGMATRIVSFLQD